MPNISLAGDKSMHDDYIVGYSINISEKSLIIQTSNNNDKKERIIFFSDVLTHSFRCILDYNLILDINEYQIDSFIADNKAELEELQGYCWPIEYQSEEELKSFLIDNGYKYIKMNSSYGLFGWILAKSYQINEHPMDFGNADIITDKMNNLMQVKESLVKKR